jgi:hypothetical protein
MKSKLFLIVAVCLCLLFVFSSLSMAYDAQVKCFCTNPNISDTGTISCFVHPCAIVDFDCSDNNPSWVSFNRTGQHSTVAVASEGGFEFDVWSNVKINGKLTAGKLTLLGSSPAVQMETLYTLAPSTPFSVWKASGTNIIQTNGIGLGWHDQFFKFKPNALPNQQAGKYTTDVTYTVCME